MGKHDRLLDDAAAGYSVHEPRITVAVETLVDRNAAVAQATAQIYAPDRLSGVMSVATGSSKREPGDQFDAALGEEFAIGRALYSLGRSIMDHANEEVARRCHG